VSALRRTPPGERRLTLLLVPEGARGEVRSVTLSMARLRQLVVAFAGLFVATGALVFLSAFGLDRSLSYSSLMDENLALKGRLLDVENRQREIDRQLQRLRAMEAELSLDLQSFGPLEPDEADVSGLPEVQPRPLRPGEAGPPMDELDPLEDPIQRLESLSALADSSSIELERLEESLGLQAEVSRDWRNAEGLPERWPLQGVLTSGFGWRRSPFTRAWKFHMGVDIAAPRGSVIIAPGPGRVIRAEYESGYGRVLELDHGDGVMSRYGHNSRILVELGEMVRTGQPIATVGMTGHTTGPHLHYELYLDGQPVDPLEVLE
jgi:murein DD-endopeptidase MepM/ murein hydrolase activator NlpD